MGAPAGYIPAVIQIHMVLTIFMSLIPPLTHKSANPAILLDCRHSWRCPLIRTLCLRMKLLPQTTCISLPFRQIPFQIQPASAPVFLPEIICFWQITARFSPTRARFGHTIWLHSWVHLARAVIWPKFRAGNGWPSFQRRHQGWSLLSKQRITTQPRHIPFHRLARPDRGLCLLMRANCT